MAGQIESRDGLAPSKISQKLRSRQQVARLLHDLLTAEDAQVLDACTARLLAAGHDLLVMIGRALETADPQAVSRLGALAAAYPDRAAVVAVLRAEALNAANSDLRRMAAMVVLEQFLDQVLEDYFFSTLRDPAQVAMNSLVQVLESAHHDRNLLLAYLSALEEQHPAALATVLDSLEKLPGDQGVEILKLLAQHEDEDLADHARQMLAQQRTEPALRTLRMLELVTPAPRRARVQRSLRKLQMAGVALPPWDSAPPGARALVTGVDGSGASALWFVLPRADGAVQLLSLLLSDTRGLTDAFGGDNFSPESFPSPAPVGTVHPGLDSRTAPGDPRQPGVRPGAAEPGPVPVPAQPALADRLFADLLADDPLLDDPEDSAFDLAGEEGDADFLEIDFDYGRHLVAAGQEINWATGTPLPWEYRLLHDLIWRFGPPAGSPVAPSRVDRRDQDPASLLLLPYFQSWRLHHESIYALAEDILARCGGRLLDLPLPGMRWAGSPAHTQLARDLRGAATALGATYFTAEQRALYARRLRRSAEWLQQAGDAPSADLAFLAAADLDAHPAEHNSFAVALVERSVLLAARNLLMGYDPRTALLAGEE